MRIGNLIFGLRRIWKGNGWVKLGMLGFKDYDFGFSRIRPTLMLLAAGDSFIGSL